jgi:hypothetical protein
MAGESQAAMERAVVVCDKCLTASCWHGVFMCQGSTAAGLTTRTVAELTALGLEHPDNYSEETVALVEGRSPAA